MFDTLIAQMCNLIVLNSSGFIPQNQVCVPVVRAVTMEGDFHQNMDLTEKYFVQGGTRFAFDTFGEGTIKTIVGLGYAQNIYQTQRLQLQAPMGPLADNINLTMYSNYCNVMMNWHWNFK